MTKMRLLLVQNFTVTTQLSLLLKKSLVESQKARLTFNLSLRNRRNCFCLCEQNAELILLALKARGLLNVSYLFSAQPCSSSAKTLLPPAT